MTSRPTARADLLAALAPLGFDAGRIGLPTLWPALSAWMRDPATDVEPQGDERSFYLSRAPRDATREAMTFAGTAPTPIAGRDLVCLEFARTFQRAGDAVTLQLGTVGFVLWYADGPAWEALTEMPGWIAAGPSTPHLDASARGDEAGWLTNWIETSPAFAVACGQAPLAAEVADGEHAENLLVLGAA